jgi:hypothetical protein
MPKPRQQPTSNARTAGAARKSTRPARPAEPNPFDAIARQVNADQEARDRAAGRDDLTSKPASPAAAPPRAAAPRAGATGTRAVFRGRPTTRAETVAARARQLRLRVRANPDVDALARRLRATPAAVQAWLDTRNGRPPATAGSAAAPPVLAVPRPWKGRVPRELPELKGATLVTRYEVRPDGTVWRTLSEVLGPDGRPLEDFWRLPLDFRPRPETLGNRRRVTLEDRSRHGLEAWLAKAGRDAPA